MLVYIAMGWKLMKENYYIRLYQKIDDTLIKKSELVKTNKYNIGIITSRGVNQNRRFNQDCAAIVTHPRGENLAMLIVADGLDDSVNGYVASQVVVRRLGRWFERLPKTYVNNPIILESFLFEELRDINTMLYEGIDKSSEAAFSLAILGKRETMIANVGSCRGYTIKGTQPTLQTVDHLKWFAYNPDLKISPDEVKFLLAKDGLSKTVGGSDSRKHYFEPSINIIDNNYDSLVLTTHGVTDVLDGDELGRIVGESSVESALAQITTRALFANPEQVPEALVERFQKVGKARMLMRETVPGSAASTAIVLKKTKKNS